MQAPGNKTVTLDGGHAHGRHVVVSEDATQLTLPVDPDDRFGTWTVYRPSGERSADGLEIWREYLESRWLDTAPADP
jgi:hypothetical protein